MTHDQIAKLEKHWLRGEMGVGRSTVSVDGSF
jgi:hypothetical protein